MATLNEFRLDRTGKRFASHLATEPLFAAAFEAVVAHLAQPSVRDHMQQAEERFDKPALRGVDAELEEVPAVRQLRLSRPDLGDAFNRAVGVLVRMTMEEVGWRAKKGAGATGLMGPSSAFRSAQRYERVSDGDAPSSSTAPPVRPSPGTPEYAAHAKAALDRVARMGTPEEQAETFEYLMKALAETRAEEGRPF